MAKSCVTPLKTITIPRLELTAAVVSVRIHKLLKGELEYDNISEIFWTDSKVVLGYIANDSKIFHVYVANRVQTIRDHTSADQWRFVEMHNNPADHASRDMTADELTVRNVLTVLLDQHGAVRYPRFENLSGSRKYS